jgi:phospholipase/lecithinase/hemolysin
MKIIPTICALFFSTLLSAAPLNKLIVFGDSLSDNGNLYNYLKHQLPLSPPYFEGRFTNGPVWVELLMKSYYPSTYAEHLEDYAFGGAGVLEEDDDGLFTLRGEVNNYFLVNDGKANSNDLYTIWIGSNNYLALPDDPEQAITDVINGIQANIQKLVDKGAKHILVLNLPNLDTIPGAQDFDAVDLLGYLSTNHNKILKEKVDEFKQRYPDVQWLYFDLSALMNDIINHPQTYGFTNVTETCYEAAMPQASSNRVLKMVSTIKPHMKNGPCDGYLFFDPVHPSEMAHVIMARKVREMLDRERITF